MNTYRTRRFATALLALAISTAPLVGESPLRSKSGDIVVMKPHTLPEAAQLGGNSLFLHSTDNGSYYLYVEQKSGAQLATFDVTDPAHIRTVSITSLAVSGAFDFVRPLSGKAELVRFRDGQGVAVLDMAKAAHPTLHVLSAPLNVGQFTMLGETGLLAMDEPYTYTPANPRDEQVVDLSAPSSAVLLTTVKQVKHQTANDDTGTTFLLGSDGLTVVRRLTVEHDYAVHQQQMSGN